MEHEVEEDEGDREHGVAHIFLDKEIELLLVDLLREDLGDKTVITLLRLKVIVDGSVMVSHWDLLLQGSICGVIVTDPIELKRSAKVQERSHIQQLTSSNDL